MGKLERLCDIVLPDDLQPRRLPQRAVFFERFVDHVPAVDASLISADDRTDVVVHTLQEGIPAERIAFLILENPLWSLVVPDQSMTNDVHVILLAEGNVC